MCTPDDQLWSFLSQTEAYSSKSLSEKIGFILQSGLANAMPSIPIHANAVAHAMVAKQREAQKHTCETLLVEMASLARQFQQAHVRVAFLKGPLLGALLYDEMHLRPTSDIDLYVEYGQVAKAMDILQQAEYTNRNEGVYSSADYLYDFHRGDPRMKIMNRHSTSVKRQGVFCYTVELHANPFRNYETCSNQDLQKTSDLLFGALRLQEYAGAAYPTLNHSDQFLSLCSHFARHTVEELAHFCSSEDTTCPISLHHLHDLALYYEKYRDSLPASLLLALAKQYACAADLAFAAKYLCEIYGVRLFHEIGSACLTLAQEDIENNIYIDIVEIIGAEELIFGNRAEVMSQLKEADLPVKSYHCQPFDEKLPPEADCEVCESYDDPHASPQMRPLLHFSWGAALSDTTLSLCVSIPEKEVLFLPSSENAKKANTSVRVYLCSSCDKKGKARCCNIHEISIFMENDVLRAVMYLNGNELPTACSFFLKEGKYILYAKITLPITGQKVLRFMISREVSLRSPGTTKPCNFAVRWINSVAVSHQTCLSFGELHAHP